MGSLFFQMPCLSESREIKRQEIYERLFDKKVDKGHLEAILQKFLLLNKKMFSFLGIGVEINGVGGDLSIRFNTAGYVGAIPVKMPYDGIVHKDFQVVPRFNNSDNVFADLTQLLSVLDYSISPEYADFEELASPLQLRPPLYYEAVKFIELFEAAQKKHWVKFETVKNNHNFPKSGTDWGKYAKMAAVPEKALQYPVSESILSVNHREWQQLTYVFDIAKSIICQQSVPERIRYKYRDKIATLQKKNNAIRALATDVLVIRASDTHAIKEVKSQGNILLQQGVTSCVAWRIDMAQLFERYVQYVVSRSLRGIDGNMIPNRKIRGRGAIPAWGLRHLEPDMMIKCNAKMYMADAKYKAHYYAAGKNSEILKETHRADLHQILAYCSFVPDKDKAGILFYPSNEPVFKEINYLESLGGVDNTVYLYGIPFGINWIDSAADSIRNLFLRRYI